MEKRAHPLPAFSSRGVSREVPCPSYFSPPAYKVEVGLERRVLPNPWSERRRRSADVHESEGAALSPVGMDPANKQNDGTKHRTIGQSIGLWTPSSSFSMPLPLNSGSSSHHPPCFGCRGCSSLLVTAGPGSSAKQRRSRTTCAR